MAKQTKTLHLILKRKWFDMIRSGEKKEEYREIKPYWINRLAGANNDCVQWDSIIFTNGYSKTSPRMEIRCTGVDIDTGKPEWGAEPGKNYFVIKLGEVVNG